MATFRPITGFSFLFLAIGVASARELVFNGGFESQFSGWTVLPAAIGSSLSIGPGRASANSLIFSADNMLDDKLIQSLATDAGQRYTLSFWLRNETIGNDAFRVLWRGQVVFEQWPIQHSGEWARHSIEITATSTQSQLWLGGWDAPGNVFVDDVSVTPVPEPIGAAAMGFGLLQFVRSRRVVLQTDK